MSILYASQIRAISFINDIFVAKNALDVYLIISASFRPVQTKGALIPLYIFCIIFNDFVSPFWIPIIVLSGMSISRTAEPSRRNSGLETILNRDDETPDLISFSHIC